MLNNGVANGIGNGVANGAANGDQVDLVSRYTTLLDPAEVASSMADDDCNICMDKLTNESSFEADSSVAKLVKCGHTFHRACLKAMVANSAGNANAGNLRCPHCKADHGERRGICPAGTMSYYVTPDLYHVPGFSDAQGTIVINYDVKRGVQGPEHPNPGSRYHTVGFPRQCFLPDNPQGRLVLQVRDVGE